MPLQPKKAPAPVLRRLSNYHHLLGSFRERRLETISSTELAALLEYTPIQIRKDLQIAGLVGKPKTGYRIDAIEKAITHYLGWTREFKAVLFGAGNLGSALLHYPWHDNYGIQFIAAFDAQRSKTGRVINGTKVHHLSHFDAFARHHQIDVGAIAVPAGQAQHVADLIASHKIRGVWNFSPIHVILPTHTTAEDAFFTQSLAVLTRRLVESD